MKINNKKKYYSAGMISIILLPILCMCFFIKRDVFKQYGFISIALWDGKETDIGTFGIQKYLDTKKYVVFNLTGNNNADKIKLQESEKIIRQIIKSKDSVTGVKFHFGDESQYWTFIKAVEILNVENAVFFVPYKNDIWFTNPRIKKGNPNKIQFVNCGTTFMSSSNKKIEMDSKINWVQIIENIKKYFAPIILYLGMIYFTLKKYKIEKCALKT